LCLGTAETLPRHVFWSPRKRYRDTCSGHRGNVTANTCFGDRRNVTATRVLVTAETLPRTRVLVTAEHYRDTCSGHCGTLPRHVFWSPRNAEHYRDTCSGHCGSVTATRVLVTTFTLNYCITVLNFGDFLLDFHLGSLAARSSHYRALQAATAHHAGVSVKKTKKCLRKTNIAD